MNANKEAEQIKQIKKTWSKPRLISGKEIGFFGLGRVQSTGYGTTPS